VNVRFAELTYSAPPSAHGRLAPMAPVCDSALSTQTRHRCRGSTFPERRHWIGIAYFAEVHRICPRESTCGPVELGPASGSYRPKALRFERVMLITRSCGRAPPPPEYSSGSLGQTRRAYQGGALVPPAGVAQRWREGGPCVWMAPLPGCAPDCRPKYGRSRACEWTLAVTRGNQGVERMGQHGCQQYRRALDL
jgi:hypothetical protein